jgi:hypothetical protein
LTKDPNRRACVVDETMLRDHLRLAERHVAEGTEHLRRQRAIVAGMEREGQDASLARDTLALFEKSQATHLADRDRLRAEIHAARPGPPADD